jgi:hypothetical protein
MGLYRLFGFCVVALVTWGGASPAFAQSPVSFPWSCSKSSTPTQPAGPAPIYRTLGKVSGPDVKPQPVVLQPLPPQEAYAYGWFGSNPTPIWNRHFGYFKSFTQWSQY